jgi:hypothetical protein
LSSGAASQGSPTSNWAPKSERLTLWVIESLGVCLRNAEAHEPLVGANIADAVEHDLAERLVLEVVHTE